MLQPPGAAEEDYLLSDSSLQVENTGRGRPALLKAEVVKLHDCAKFSRICAKFRLLRAKLVKQALFFMILTQSDKV